MAVIRIGGNTALGDAAIQTAFYAAGIAGATVSGVPVLVNTSTGQLGVASSSRRFKEDIHDMSDASDGLMRLRPVTFRYKQPFEDGAKPLQYGLIAEEVGEVYPDLVARSPLTVVDHEKVVSRIDGYSVWGELAMRLGETSVAAGKIPAVFPATVEMIPPIPSNPSCWKTSAM